MGVISWSNNDTVSHIVVKEDAYIKMGLQVDDYINIGTNMTLTNTGRLGVETIDPHWPTHIISTGNAIDSGNVDVSELALVIP